MSISKYDYVLIQKPNKRVHTAIPRWRVVPEALRLQAESRKLSSAWHLPIAMGKAKENTISYHYHALVLKQFGVVG